MDRLIRLTAVMLLLTGLTGHLRADRFTVAGDVSAPQTREYPAGPVSIQTLLRDAGADRPGTAVVIRGESGQAFTEYVDLGAAGTESILMNGDVVVFRTTESPAAAANVVVVGQGGAVIVNLSGSGSQLGFLLHHLKIPYPAGQDVPVIRTVQGGPVRMRLTGEAPLQHGDVLLLSDLFAVGQDFGSSAFAGASDVMPDAVPVSHQETAIQESAAGVPGGECELRLPPIDVPIPADDHAAVADAVDPNDRMLSDIPLTLAALELSVDDAEAAAAVPAGGQTDASESTARVSPTSVGEMPAGQNQPPVPPFWNAVFLSGLLGAVVLIVSGWLKVRREQIAGAVPEAEPDSRMDACSVPASRTVSRTEDEGAKGQNVFQEAATGAAGSEVPVCTDRRKEDRERASAGEEEPTTRPAANSVQADPVADEEWYGRDWRSGNGSAGRSFHGAEHRQGHPSKPQDDVIPLSMIAGASRSPQVGDPAADDLEDLIHNRLPVIQRDAELPQHVSLYGRPAGPRRLRIDAAHTDLAAPNFAAAAAEKSGRQPTAAVHGSPRPVRSDEESGEQAAPDASLDRALNSLHGQEDR